MVREARLDADVELLWEEFHERVNMPSAQLRQWLLTRGSGEEAFGPNPDLDLPVPGRHILALLAKRKVDLTPEDVRIMQDTVDRIDALTAQKPPGGNADDGWRHALLDLGHDPLAVR